MRELSEQQIRSSFINVSQRERANITMPKLGELQWDRLEFLGWRDPRGGQVGWVLVEDGDDVIGIAVRQTDARTTSRPQCSWCEDITLPNDVVFFSARRAGHAGRNGDTVGILACEQFECTTNVRRLGPLPYVGYDREAARQRRIATLADRVLGFVREVQS